MHGAEITDDKEDTCDVGDHGKDTPLSHTLLAVQEVAGTIHVEYHQSVPVEIAVEGELCASRKLELDGLQNYRPIILIELVLRINKE